ncbi:MAG: ATP-binding protein, partial [Candidatus Cryptobacteroides sp.]
IIASFEDMASKKNVFIDFDSAEKSLICDYDKKKIDKIFVNLISNAIKFTKENGQVVVSFRRKESLEMEIMVADSGVGIAEKDLPHIFERFYSVDNYSSLGSGGTGLGLMIVKNLVELHGGTVSVYSKVNVGSTFIVNMPIVHELHDVVVPASELVSVHLEKNHPYSVLIVEDDENMRNYLVSELGRHYDILPFSNAEDALAAMENLMPDLVVSDVMFGDDRMSGTDLCRRLRANDLWKTLPVILLTAVSSEDQVVEGFDAGANDYIGKPFNIHVLCTRIDNLLGHIQHLREAINKDVLSISQTEIKSPDDVFITKLVSLIEENIAEPDLNIPFLCDRMSMSHVSFYRKVKSLTGQNINSFVREIRLKKAAQMLKVSGISVTEAMYAVGFSHRSYFSLCFKELFGMTPKLYARQFNNNEKDEKEIQKL